MSTCSVLILTWALSIAPAAAQEQVVVAPDAAAAATEPESPQVPFRPWGIQPERPSALPVLYVGYGALQAADLWQTATLVDAGAREINPVMAGATGRRAAMIALKAATTAGTFYFVERLWKDDHRVAAIVTMVAVTGMSAAVVANNARHMTRR